MARSRALAWASDFLTRYHLELEAGNLGYNAMTRRITLTDVRLAAEGHHDRPFLIASRIEVRLPWSVFAAASRSITSIIDHGIVDIVRDENNVVNLPPSSNAPTPERARATRYPIADAERPRRAVRGSAPQLGREGAAHRVRAAQHARSARRATSASAAASSFHLRDRVMTMAPFETVMTFDGSNVMLEQARLSSPEIDAFLSGPINRVLDSPSLDLSLKGSVNLDKAIEWVPPPPVPVTGMATIEGIDHRSGAQLRRSISPCTATRSTSAASAISTVSGPVRVTFESFSGHDLVISPQIGRLDPHQVHRAVGQGRRSAPPSAEWSGLDSQAALRMADVDPQAIGALLRRPRHVRVQRSAQVRDSQPIDAATRGARRRCR